MMREVEQVKRFIAKKHGLPLEGSGYTCRVVGKVPDGHHVIPLGQGEKLMPFYVEIKDGNICIHHGVADVLCYHCDEPGAINRVGKDVSTLECFLCCESCWEKFLNDVAVQYGLVRL